MMSISSFSRTFHLPFVTTSPSGQRDGTDPLRSQFTVYVRPLYEEAMMDVIRFYGWTHILYIYDSIEGKSLLLPLI